MAITVELITQDVSIGLEWRTLSIQESIGQPDTLSIEMVEINDLIRTLLGPIDNYLYTAVRKNRRSGRGWPLLASISPINTGITLGSLWSCPGEGCVLCVNVSV